MNFHVGVSAIDRVLAGAVEMGLLQFGLKAVLADPEQISRPDVDLDRMAVVRFPEGRSVVLEHQFRQIRIQVSHQVDR